MLVSIAKKYWILGSLVIVMVPLLSLQVLAQSKTFVRPQPQILSQLTAIDYYNRGIAKAKLGDNQGGINDLRQAARLYQQQNKMEDYQTVMNVLKELGISN
jgi:hypothetical protein